MYGWETPNGDAGFLDAINNHYTVSKHSTVVSIIPVRRMKYLNGVKPFSCLQQHTEKCLYGKLLGVWFLSLLRFVP